jgi:hypothetical protein
MVNHCSMIDEELVCDVICVLIHDFIFYHFKDHLHMIWWKTSSKNSNIYSKNHQYESNLSEWIIYLAMKYCKDRLWGMKIQIKILDENKNTKT